MVRDSYRRISVTHDTHEKWMSSSSATCCNTLQRTATHCNSPLQHTLQQPTCRVQTCAGPLPMSSSPATRCNTLQRTATTHCNTLQHTATHCNNPPPKSALVPGLTMRASSATCCNTLRRTATTHCNNTLQQPTSKISSCAGPLLMGTSSATRYNTL